MIRIIEKTGDEVGDCDFCNTPTQFGLASYVPDKKVYVLESDQIMVGVRMKLCERCLDHIKAVTK